MIKFNSPTQAIAYYHYKNPARAKYFNIFEPDSRSPVVASQFSGDHPHDIYASIVGALVTTQKAFKQTREWRAFWTWYLNPERNDLFSKEDLAEQFGVKRRQLERYLESVMDYFAIELFERELLSYSPENNEYLH